MGLAWPLVSGPAVGGWQAGLPWGSWLAVAREFSLSVVSTLCCLGGLFVDVAAAAWGAEL